MLEAPGAAAYNDVAPERSQQVAYWQRPFVEQPRFLKAALLQRDDQWPELESLAVEWARDDASDPEPWYLMGVALARMDRLPEAQRALDCSLAAGPASSAAGSGPPRLAVTARHVGALARRAHAAPARAVRASARASPRTTMNSIRHLLEQSAALAPGAEPALAWHCVGGEATFPRPSRRCSSTTTWPS